MDLPLKNAKILIVDDDQAMRDLLRSIFEDETTVFTLDKASSVLSFIQEQSIDLILLDICLGEENGLDLLPQIKKLDPNIEVIMITVLQDIASAVKAMKNGAYDYINKNFDFNEVKLLAQKALDKRALNIEVEQLREEIKKYQEFDFVSGQSSQSLDMMNLVQRIAPLPSNILIQGESGTGKEMIARLIHSYGSSEKTPSHRPFIGINLASIPDNLLESTLFGHEKGSFTGAVKTHRGKFELAHGGTLFLDEISELKYELQAKLLRAIQEREIERVGGETPIPVKVRIIAATNKNLKELVAQGKFREDLFYRLNVIPIKLAPLRERLEDLPEFVRFFTAKYSRLLNKNVQSLTPETMACLQAYSWPGNIRELENTLERMVALSTHETLNPDDLPPELKSFLGDDVEVSQFPSHDLKFDEILKRATDAFEKGFILNALDKQNWNQVKAAESLGIHRKTLEYKIKRHMIHGIIEAKRQRQKIAQTY